MHYDYVIAGNVMLDKVVFKDGTVSGRESIGGPATFAYSGVRIWTDSVMQCSNVGADYERLFKPWIEKNKVVTDGYKVICDRCNHSIMYFKDTNGERFEPEPHEISEEEKWLKNDAWQDFGYMKTKPEELEVFTKGANVKGVYVAQNADRTIWNKFSAIKKRDGLNLDLGLIDVSEKDNRTIQEILDEMSAEHEAINKAFTELKAFLGGIDL